MPRNRFWSSVERLERRQFLAATVAEGVWNITGDANRRAPADVIVVAPVEQSPAELRVTINGVDAGTVQASSITQVRIDAGRGNDRVTIDIGSHSSTINVVVFGGIGHDRITGAGETDEFHGGGGNDRLDGGGGNDSLFGDVASDQLLGGDGDDNLVGASGNDVLAGGWGRDSLAGDKGADRLRGGGGDDSLDGGAGNDRLEGGDGADNLSGGKGADRLLRQEGVDTVGPLPGGAPVKTDKRDQVSQEVVEQAATRQQDDAELKKWLIDAAVKQWAWAFGQPAFPWGYFYGIDGEVMIGRGGAVVNDGAGGGVVPPPSAPPAPVPVTGGVGNGINFDNGSPTSPEGAPDPDHSDTNVQEAGVDEADLVETDGQFIYTLNESNLVIVDATPAEQMSVVSRTAFQGDAAGIYLHGDRLTVISTTYSWHIQPLPITDVAVGAPSIILPPTEPPKTEVFVTVFDVSNPAAPSQIEKTTLDGVYAGSRRVNDRLYLVIQNDTWVPPPLIIPNPETEPDPDPDPTTGVDPTSLVAPDVIGWNPRGLPGGTYETEAAYRARLEAMSLADLLPSYHATSLDGESTGLLVKSTDSYVRDLDSSQIGQNLTTVALLDLGDTAGGPDATTTVAGFGGTVYSSADAMYIATASGGMNESKLLKFHLAPDAVPLVATGVVDGSVLDQFSMDEEGDFFRIATTGFDNTVGDPTNDLFVLEQIGDELNVVGHVDDIEQGETLRSARFVGDRAYLVTFLQVDPLLTVNLTDPTDPRITGKLVIPGFSSYLQPIGEGLLLGIGRDIDPNTNQMKGVQLSLFDVSDDDNPVRLDSFLLAENWSSSEAEFDHHAFAYFSDQRILALPVNQFNSNTGASAEKLVVLHIDPSKGSNAIEKLGEPIPPQGVRRSLRIGEVLYAVGPQQVRSLNLGQPDQVLGTVELKST